MSVTDVTLDKPTLEITVGNPDVKLTATIAPENATDKTVSWSSDKTEFATVDNQGNVHAVAPGIANITVTTTDGGKTATCAVIVKAALPEGALSGVFSVSATKKVYFSKGNLVATIDATGAPTAWKFATNQYDYIGEGGANKTIGKTAGDIDLFGWSTDATLNNWGIHTKLSYMSGCTDYIDGNFKDWGTAIDSKGTWRTLSAEEWQYLFNNHSNKWASVNGVNGYVIAPDGFAGTLADSYTDDAALAADNLVFLPAAGARQGSGVAEQGSVGNYWSSEGVNRDAFFVWLRSDLVQHTFLDRGLGCSVRLVTEVK